MPTPANGALFDVKPVDESGSVDISRIAAVRGVVNLTPARRRKIADDPEFLAAVAAKKTSRPVLKNKPVAPIRQEKKESTISIEKVVPSAKTSNTKDQFESFLNEETDLHVELAKIGAQTHSFSGKPRYRPIARIKDKELRIEEAPKKQEPEYQHPIEFDAILAEIQYSRARAARAPEMPAMARMEKPIRSNGEAFGEMRPVLTKSPVISRSLRTKSKTRRWRPSRRSLIIVGSIVLGLLLLASGGWGLKNHITSKGQAAVAELEHAKADLENLNFEGASQDFLKAYQSFSSAGAGLNFMGATISSLLAALPGGETVKSAQNLVKIGKLLADSGAAMTDAAQALANAGSAFTPGATTTSSIAVIMTTLQRSLAVSAKDVSDIKALLADTDVSVIPEDKREAFEQLSALVPTIEEVVSHGAEYAKFFADASGLPGTHRYLILFENSAELRPTGGFPGSYGVVTFKDGKLTDFFVDDIYNLDGQIKHPVVPPVPLQHITPDWGMRDTNWFVDFPTSARVIADFYKMESGQAVEGVITINPSLMTDILKIIGPVSMPQYGLTLNADNFIPTIQSQIEYVADRAQPKQVLKDFVPLLMAKLRTASSDQWLTIFNSIIAGLDRRTVLMYFDNLNLEAFADNQGFAGQVRQAEGEDFLMPVISNVKGSKTDLVTDTSFKLNTVFEDTSAVHTLTITRTHNGGNEKYGFYNKQNPAYMRVLVPAGAELISIEGDDKTNFKPLLNYPKTDFKTNETLAKFESTDMEAGKKEFQFWLITDAGKTKTVTVKYRVPNIIKDSSYNLYFQKQPGLVIKNLSVIAGEYSRVGPLEKDLAIKVQLP